MRGYGDVLRFAKTAGRALLALALLGSGMLVTAPRALAETDTPPRDFIRSTPSPTQAAPQWLPRSGAVRVTLVTVQTADKTASDAASINLGAATSAISAASNYWSSISGGRLSLMVSITVTGFKTSAGSDWNFDDILATVTRELGWVESPNTALVVFMPRNDVMVYGSPGNLGAGWSGGATSGRVLMPYPGAYTNPVVAHEFGHVFGLDHANSLQCTDGSADSRETNGKLDNGNCYSREYGNDSSLMGPAQGSIPAIDSYQYDFGSFGNGNEIFDAGTAVGTKSYTLTPWAGMAANRALKFCDPISREVYYLELRMPVGYDTGTAVNGNRGVEILKADPSNPAASLIIMPNTRPYNGWYNPNLAWQGGTFTTVAGTRVNIDYINGGAAGITIQGQSPYASYFKFENASTVYGKHADGTFKALGWNEYSSLGTPAVATLPAVQFVKNSWSSSIYIVESSGKGKALNFADWTAYGQPTPELSQLLPRTHFYNKFNDSTLYYSSPGGEATVTLPEWKQAGSPPIALPVRYVKYPWESTIYKEEATVSGQSESAAKVSAMNFAAWSSDGYPIPESMAFVAGSAAYKYSNLGTIFLKSPLGVIHELTYPEWTSIPADSRSFADVGVGRFVKNSWNGSIYLIGTDNKGSNLTYDQWKNYGKPNPETSALIPGSTFVKLAGDTTLYYDSPAGIVTATSVEYAAGGSPAVANR